LHQASLFVPLHFINHTSYHSKERKNKVSYKQKITIIEVRLGQLSVTLWQKQEGNRRKRLAFQILEIKVQKQNLQAETM